MCEYSQYYEAFTARLLHGEGLTPDRCRCHGGGWILSDLDTWHRCPDHYVPGQPHPEDDVPTDEEVYANLSEGFEYQAPAPHAPAPPADADAEDPSMPDECPF